MQKDRKNVYALFFDIDGTLLFDGKIPPENAEALQKAKERGHKLFINTGRSRGNMPQNLLALPCWSGCCCGGAYAEIDGRIIFNKTMSFPDYLHILDYCERRGCGVAVESVEGFHTYRTDRWKSPPSSREEMLKLFPEIQVTKVTFDRVLTDFDGLTGLCFTQFPTYTEAFLKGCGKADIMKKVIYALGIDGGHTAAFGDSLNDRDMLEAAAVSAVMAHAPDELKKSASIVTKTSENGVAEALEKLISDGVL